MSSSLLESARAEHVELNDSLTDLWLLLLLLLLSSVDIVELIFVLVGAARR